MEVEVVHRKESFIRIFLESISIWKVQAVNN